MQSNAVKAAVGLFLVAAAVVLFIVLQGGDSNGSGDTTSAAAGDSSSDGGPGTPTIVIRGGEPVGGVAQLDYTSGEQVRFRVRSDVSDEVHVHGYDISKDVEAGGSVGFDFPASIEGVFEAELEGRRVQIAEIRVSP